MTELLNVSEQHDRKILNNLSDHLKLLLSNKVCEKQFYHKSGMLCFQLFNEDEVFFINTNYFVGVDWLVQDQAAIYVEPKLNDSQQVNYLKMLFESLEAPENLEHLDHLFNVEYEKPWISIQQEKDILSPILIIQFLKLVQKIVRKGLKKSYYRITSNLNSRVKGKILVGKQIKENVLKNRLTKTICNYQEFGINTKENQFIKLVLEFVSSYLAEKRQFFSPEQNAQLQNILNYCQPAFEMVDKLEEKHQKVYIKKNPFYNEYTEAIKIGEFILKRFSFTISKASQTQTSTPPFWIDMSKLFELYVFGKLKKLFPQSEAMTYHDTYLGGKETDILIRQDPYKCVIDCKYKPRYKDHTPSLEDKRQLAGYARMLSVYNRLSIPKDQIINALIIYSHQSCSHDIEMEKLFSAEIGEYVQFYKLGVGLPELSV